MADFEFDSSAFDEIEESLNTLSVSCPICGKDFNITLDDLNTTVVCPHCEATIELESN